jgi:hypothetical protein
MAKTKSWYSEQGTEERPSSLPGMVALYRCGKLIAHVPADDKHEAKFTAAK